MVRLTHVHVTELSLSTTHLTLNLSFFLLVYLTSKILNLKLGGFLSFYIFLGVLVNGSTSWTSLFRLWIESPLYFLITIFTLQSTPVKQVMDDLGETSYTNLGVMECFHKEISNKRQLFYILRFFFSFRVSKF